MRPVSRPVCGADATTAQNKLHPNGNGAAPLQRPPSDRNESDRTFRRKWQSNARSSFFSTRPLSMLLRMRRDARGCGFDGRIAQLDDGAIVRVRLLRLWQTIERVGHRAYQRLDAFSGGGRNRKERQAAFLRKFAQAVETFMVAGRVELGGDDKFRLRGQSFAEGPQFALNNFKIADRIAVGRVAGIDEVGDQARALDVPEEANAQAGAFVRAFNQAGQIRDDESAARAGRRVWIGGDDSEMRFQSGERIIGDFRFRRGNTRDECRFPRVGKSDKAYVGEQT